MSSSPFSYTCELCGVEGLTDDGMRTHTLEAHVAGRPECPFCDCIVPQPQLVGHVQKAHLHYLTPERELMAFIDDQSPGYDEDSKMTTDSCSYTTPGSFNGWNSPDSASSYQNGGVSKNNLNYSYQNGQHNGGYKDELDKISRSPKNINLNNGIGNVNLKKNSSNDHEFNGAHSSQSPNHSSYEGSPSKNKMTMASAGEGSPLRSQLALKLRANTPKNSVPKPSPTMQCPLCEYKSSCAKKLEEHINRAHFDLTSPSLIANANVPYNPTAGQTTTGGHTNPTIALTSAMALTPGDETPRFQCPICEKDFRSGADVELHVNVDHRDILSPQNNDEVDDNSAGACSSDVEMDNNQCPVCGEPVSANKMFGTLETSTSLPLDHDSPKVKLAKCESFCKTIILWSFGIFNFHGMMEHIENHFSRTEEGLTEEEKEAQCIREQHEFQLLRAQYGMEEDEEGAYADRTAHGLKRAVYSGTLSVAGYYERSVGIKKAAAVGRDDGCSRTTGLLERIAEINSQNSGILKTYLCSAVDHYASTYGDRGWGCGYRNMQMLLSCLVRSPEYSGLLSEGWSSGSSQVPSIPTLQLLVERAWTLGFDTQGSEQLGCTLHNTRKWIGACEVITVLSSLKIKCSLIDFHKPTGTDGDHPALFDWVHKYFDTNPEEFKPPIYLQHQGHSRTIIGYEQHRDGKASLLVLDPSHAPAQVRQVLSSSTTAAVTAVRLLRRGSSALRARQYQLMAVSGVLHDPALYEASKVLQSIRIP